MSVILAIETSTPACSVALTIDGVLLEDFRLAPRQHNDLILPMVDQLLTQANIRLKDLDAIAFGKGPGSFTGLRIAAGVVQGLAYGADLPVIGISTLEAMALEAFQKYHKDYWLAALDARMGEVYIGGYKVLQSDQGMVIETHLPVLATKPENLPPQSLDYGGIGSGWCYQDILQSKLSAVPAIVDIDLAPRASCIAELAKMALLNGKTFSAYEAIPSYIRDEVTWEKQPLKVGKR